jgi:ABC-type maltose transport system permease subunit
MISINNLLLIIFALLMIVSIVKILDTSFKHISFDVQKDMTIDNSNSQKKVTYEEFINLFKSQSWYIVDTWKRSFFNYEEYNKSKIHAGILKIDNIGLLPKDYETYKKIDAFLNNLWNCKHELSEWQKDK